MSKVTTLELHGKLFNVEKRDGVWQTNYRDARATSGGTKREAVDLLKAVDKGKILSSCDYHDKRTKRITFFKDHTAEFTAIFGFSPPRDFFMFALGQGLCLDVIALDKKLYTPDGISTNDYILKNYGQHAVDIVKQMI